MGCAAPTASRARSSLILSCICFPMLSPSCWQGVRETQIPLLGTPAPGMLHRTGAASLQQCPCCPCCHPGCPTAAGTGQKDKQRPRWLCQRVLSRSVSPPHPVPLQDSGWAPCPGPRSSLCHPSARLCCSPGPSGWRGRGREMMLRVGRVCLDLCDGLCTTHTSPAGLGWAGHPRKKQQGLFFTPARSSREAACAGRAHGRDSSPAQLSPGHSSSPSSQPRVPSGAPVMPGQCPAGQERCGAGLGARSGTAPSRSQH